jgi:hypothetical protein
VRTTTRLVLWSLSIVIPLGFGLMLHSAALTDLPGLTATDVAPITAVLSIVALMLVAFLAPAVARPESREIPGWSYILFFAGIAQLFAVLLIYTDVPGPSAWRNVYLPGALVCLNLAALIVLHAWTAGEGLGFPPLVGLVVGGACSAWILHAGGTTSLGAFHAASAAAVAGTLITAVIVALTPARSKAAAD